MHIIQLLESHEDGHMDIYRLRGHAKHYEVGRATTRPKGANKAKWVEVAKKYQYIDDLLDEIADAVKNDTFKDIPVVYNGTETMTDEFKRILALVYVGGPFEQKYPQLYPKLLRDIASDYEKFSVFGNGMLGHNREGNAEVIQRVYDEIKPLAKPRP